jgi:uncharacterized membrane protein YGL010W
VQPTRGPRTDAALNLAKGVFVICWVIGIPHMFFEVRYPIWLHWIGRLFLAVFAVAVVTFAGLRSREVIIYRHQQLGGQ